MPPHAKPKRCHSCGRKMTRAGSTVADKPVWACPRCLIVVAEGKKLLPVPETPRWKGPIETVGRKRGRHTRPEED